MAPVFFRWAARLHQSSDFVQVFRHQRAIAISQRQQVHGVGLPSLGRFGPPLQALRVVLSHTLAVEIKRAQNYHRVGRA